MASVGPPCRPWRSTARTSAILLAEVPAWLQVRVPEPLGRAASNIASISALTLCISESTTSTLDRVCSSERATSIATAFESEQKGNWRNHHEGQTRTIPDARTRRDLLHR